MILTQPVQEDDAVQVRDAEALALAESVLIAGYPMPGCARGSVLRPGLLGGATRVWLGYVDGQPASVAAAHQAAGATLVEYVAVERWSGWLRPAGTS